MRRTSLPSWPARPRRPSACAKHSRPASSRSCSAATAPSAWAPSPGTLPGEGRLGLVYLDMHGDLNTPDSVPDGALDWMGVAHMLGEDDAAPELRDFGPQTPLLADDQIVLLAHRRDQSTARELEAIERRRLATIPSSAVADDPAAAAGEALAALASCERLAVHFDVDCIDFTDAPLSENTGRNIGLTQDAAFAALAAVLLDSRVSALTISELNPDHGAEDGSTLAAFVDRLVAALAGAPGLLAGSSSSRGAGGSSVMPDPGSGGSGRRGSRMPASGGVSPTCSRRSPGCVRAPTSMPTPLPECRHARTISRREQGRIA